MNRALTRASVAVGLAITTMAAGNTAMASDNKPEVKLTTPVVMSKSTFSGNAKAAASASLVTSSKQRVWLTVDPKGMTSKDIVGKCRSVKVGTPFYNEVVDPKTGKRYFRYQKVAKGDNVFCLDRKKVWRKKSCGNEARGLTFTPKVDKRRVVTGGVVQDYLTYKGQVALNVSASGSATAMATQYSGGQLVCKATSQASATATVRVVVSVNVSARTTAQVEAAALNAAKVSINSDTQVQAALKAQVEASVKGEASASCSVSETPKPTPPPVIIVTPPTTPPVTPPTPPLEPKDPVVLVPPPSGSDGGPTRDPAPAPNPSTGSDTRTPRTGDSRA